MILLLDVHQLVKQDIVADVWRHLHEPEIERDVAVAGARPPARALVAHDDRPRQDVVLVGKLTQPRYELRLRQLAKIGFDNRSNVVAIPRARAPSAVRNDDLVAAPLDGKPNELTSKEQIASILPLAWRVLDLYSVSLARDPTVVLPYELLGFAARPAARHGHAQRSIGPHAEDITPSSAHTNELNDGMGLIGRLRFPITRRGIRNLQEREIELHDSPMVAEISAFATLKNSRAATDNTERSNHGQHGHHGTILTTDNTDTTDPS